MGEFIRENLPDPLTYFTNEGLKLSGRGKWRTAGCSFHGGSDSLRVHLERGAFMCMACGAKGGDILAYHQAAYGLGFVDAAKALGAYQEDGKPHHGGTRPSPIPARELLRLVSHEIVVASMVASDLAHGRKVSDLDRERLMTAAGRIGRVSELANV
jgi:hypothetical protein